MKSTVIAILALASGIALTNAATTISGSNNDGTTSAVPFVDNTGAPVSFTFQAGTFGALPDFGVPNGALDLSGFTPFGATFNSSIDGLLAGPPTNLDTPPVGQPLFVVATDGVEFIVLDLGIPTAAEVVGAGSISFNVLTGASSDHTGASGVVSVLRGYDTSVAPDGYPAAPFNAFNGGPALGFGVIPEPSSALLLGLGGLGLLIRRKR